MNPDPGFRSGLVSFVGRPNTGKSTLLNALVGQKIAITSSKPQTTRHTIRGILHKADGQAVIVDTPGVHRPRTLLGKRLNNLVAATWAEVDVIGLCVPADATSGKGDAFIADAVAKARGKRVVMIVTKADLVGRDGLAKRLLDVQHFATEHGLAPTHFVPVSAVTGEGLESLADVLIDELPEGPPLYPDGDLTDEPEATLIAEFIREAALEKVDDELPHSIAVVVDDMVPRDDRPEDRPLTDVYASLYVERSSQKPIVLGPGGKRIKQIGAQARPLIQAVLGTQIYLDLRVKVAKEWQRDPKQLRRLGFD